MNSPSPDEHPGRWQQLLALLVGTFSVALSLSLLFSATPRIMADLRADLTQVAWLSIAYALSFTVLQPIWGRLADLYGRKRFFVGGLAVFTLGAALCALAWDVGSMAAFRFLQGVGAAAVFPIGMAFIGEAFPAEERGRAMGVWGIAGGAAPAIGPTLGGAILDLAGWRAIYWFSVAIGLLSLAAPLWLLRESARPGKARVDYAGSVALFASMGALLLAVSQGRAWGWTSAPTLGLAAASLLGLLLLLAIERRSPAPVFDLALARSRLFVAAGLTAFVTFAALQGTLFLLPFFLMDVQGYSGAMVGVLLLPFFLPMAVASPLAGALADRWGARRTAAAGMGLATLALGLLSRVQQDTPYWVIAGLALVLGVAIAVALPPLGKAIMGAVSRSRMGAASGLFSMVRSLGGPFGVAVLASLFAERAATHVREVLSQRAPALGLDLRALAGLRELAQQGTAGLSPEQLQQLARLQEVQGQARLAGMTAAFGETFLVAAALCTLGLVAALLVREAPATSPTWSREALATLEKFPPHVRARARRGIEAVARGTGVLVVTPALAGEIGRSWRARQPQP
ncbi:MAG: DHA2 family efflux MFS transporter permease subunit [Chloroflexi bacterium]|nr:DHA2 family efflux MFS transporter permease subunit [Chloroflexota bacterium]